MSDGSLPPALFPNDYPWRVAVLSPGGLESRVRVVQNAGNPYLWSGVTRFRSRGRWTICVLNFSTSGQRCVAHSPGWQRVRVRSKDAATDVWQQLERPFHIPTIAAGSACPTATPDPRGDLRRIGFTGVAWGNGPAYPGGLNEDGRPVLRYQDPIPPQSLFSGSAWFGNKVLWMVDPVYRGPVLVRGRQVDGPNELRFDGGMLPPRMMRIVPGPSPRGRPSYTRVRAPGCYAYEVDGIGFSHVLVFEAKPV